MKRQNRDKKGKSGNRSRNFRSGGNRPGYNKNTFSGPREMHKATCAECKQDCEVPFKPIEGKPVYCRDCYSKHKKF